MKIGILIYPNCSFWSAIGPMELFNRANKAQAYYHKDSKKNAFFDIEFISSESSKVKTSYPYPIPLKATIKSHNKYDLILIPGFDASPEKIDKHSAPITLWLREQHNCGVTIASICSGSLLLALSGIINGKLATTHWLLKDYFENIFPDIPLDLSKTVIDHGNILMSGSATTFHNLIIYIIEKNMGRTIAVGVSKIYLIDLNKDRPDSYMNLIPQKRHSDKEIHVAQNYIEENCNTKLTIDKISRKAQLNIRTFIRRFKKATNETPLNYIHKVKVEKAKDFLENERMTFEEISFMLGYEDTNAFRKIFTRLTSLSPNKYRERYRVVY